MPRTGMEPVRRAALVQATIREIGRKGSADVTVGQIAQAAGVSSALAHHYFGGKEQIFTAAMRHILSAYGAEVRRVLSTSKPEGRLAAIVGASFAASNFRAEVVSAWLTFYVQAQVSGEARRLLTVYQRRLRSNLTHALRPAAGRDAPVLAETLAALIDGIYLRAALGPAPPDPDAAAAQTLAVADSVLTTARRD